MGCRNMNITLNKNKSIGKVLYIVEGEKTEPYILHRIFTKILEYNVEIIKRNKPYHQYTCSTNYNSRVFVINSEESNICFIEKNNNYLNNMFKLLIEDYDFDVDNSAIYYIFDRDSHSNNDITFIKDLISTLGNSRENDNYLRQGMLLLSYPSIESFTMSNFHNNRFNEEVSTGTDLKQKLNTLKYFPNNINEETLKFAVSELLKSFNQMNINNYDLDDFSNCNMDIFNFEEENYSNNKMYRILSLLCISLLDLGILEIS